MKEEWKMKGREPRGLKKQLETPTQHNVAEFATRKIFKNVVIPSCHSKNAKNIST